jgi:hypothetical protein
MRGRLFFYLLSLGTSVLFVFYQVGFLGGFLFTCVPACDHVLRRNLISTWMKENKSKDGDLYIPTAQLCEVCEMCEVCEISFIHMLGMSVRLLRGDEDMNIIEYE